MAGRTRERGELEEGAGSPNDKFKRTRVSLALATSDSQWPEGKVLWRWQGWRASHAPDRGAWSEGDKGNPGLGSRKKPPKSEETQAVTY